MIIDTFDRSPKILTVPSDAKPFHVWLTPLVRMTIEKNDQPDDLQVAIAEHWGMSPKLSRRVARYWIRMRRKLRERD